MAYRRYNRRYRRRRRPYYRPRKPVRYRVADMAYKGYRLASRLAKMVNVEYKQNTTSFAGASYPTYVGTINNLCDPAQGDTDITRDGDSIKVQKLHAEGVVYGDGTNNSTLRVIIFWDTQNKVSAVTDLLEVTGSAVAPFSPKVYDKRFQTKVLWDRKFNTFPTGRATIPFKIDIPIGMHTNFDNGTQTITSGALKILVISDNATVGARLSGIFRCLFTDN